MKKKLSDLSKSKRDSCHPEEKRPMLLCRQKGSFAEQTSPKPEIDLWNKMWWSCHGSIIWNVSPFAIGKVTAFMISDSHHQLHQFFGRTNLAREVMAVTMVDVMEWNRLGIRRVYVSSPLCWPKLRTSHRIATALLLQTWNSIAHFT